MIPVKHPWLNG